MPAPPEAAITRLSRMTSATDEPTLDSNELAELLEAQQCLDADGRAPTDEAWMPTFDFNAAAAEGWLRKAGAAAPSYSVAIDGQRSEQSDVYRHCTKQAELYASRVSVTMKISRT